MAYGLLRVPSNGSHVLGRVEPPGLYFSPTTSKPLQESAAGRLAPAPACAAGIAGMPPAAAGAGAMLAGGTAFGSPAFGVGSAAAVGCGCSVTDGGWLAVVGAAGVVAGDGVV